MAVVIVQIVSQVNAMNDIIEYCQCFEYSRYHMLIVIDALLERLLYREKCCHSGMVEFLEGKLSEKA